MTDTAENENQKKPSHHIFNISSSDDEQSTKVPGVANDDTTTGSDFEEAVAATGYGLYNYLLLLAVFPGGWANMFDTTAMSYILPSAECDLDLSLLDKGILNAVTFSGMTVSAFIWGFMADTKGRRSLLMFGYLADAICNVLSSLSQSFYVLVVFRFFCGFIINGPFAINLTYLAEFHSTKHRARALLWASSFPALGNVALPVLAWMVIPQSWSVSFFDGAFVYNAWRVFILLMSVPPFLGCATLLFFPESPKFLMSQGRNDEAMEVFKRMYVLNTGNPAESYPIKSLHQEVAVKEMETTAEEKNESIWDKLRSDWGQMKPLFFAPYLTQFLIIIIIQMGCIMSLNTLRLWMPQLFTMMENFDYDAHDHSLGSPTLCDMISLDVPPLSNMSDVNATTMSACVPHVISDRVYVNSIIISCATVMAYTLAGTVINLIGSKNLLLINYATAAVCAFGLRWSPDSNVTLVIICVFIALTNIAVTTIISFIVDLMPTSLRTMAVSLAMCFGRCGSMIGNLIFPILLTAGCMAPFLFVGGFLVVCFVFTIIIPKPSGRLM